MKTLLTMVVGTLALWVFNVGAVGVLAGEKEKAVACTAAPESTGKEAARDINCEQIVREVTSGMDDPSPAQDASPASSGAASQ